MTNREESLRYLFSTCAKWLHFLFSVTLFWIFWMLFRYNMIFPIKELNFRYNYLTTLGYAIMLFFFNKTYNSYLLGYTRNSELVFRQFLSQLFAISIIYIGVSLAWNNWISPKYLYHLIKTQLVLDFLWSFASNELYYSLNPAKRTILIYRNEQDRTRFGNIRGKASERLYTIVKKIQFDGSYDDIKDKLTGYDAIFVAGVNSKCRNGILKFCKEENVSGFFLPHIGDVLMREAIHIQSFDSPIMYVSRTEVSPEYRIIKRILDIFGSMIGIILLSPIMLITASAIRLYDYGPAIYKQVRVTQNGKEFKIYKFRSMRVDAEKDGIARLSSGDSDTRITPIGRIVRKCRLDEIPQLINIFKGDMSFVGPRPERPEIISQYNRTIPDFSLRLQVKAGLTGYAQVYGKYNIDPYEKLQFDLLYIKDMSILTDLRLMFATASILFKKDSTEGIKEGQTTAIENIVKKNVQPIPFTNIR